LARYSAKRSKQLVQPTRCESRAATVEYGLMQSQLGFAAAFDKRHGDQGLVPGPTVLLLPGEGEDQALGFDDFAVDAALPVIGALRRAHAEPEGAARPDIHVVGDRREALRSPPQRQLVGLDPRLEDDWARRVEHPGQRQLPLAPRTVGRGCRGHVAGPFAWTSRR
jgi:hypothetical protein